MDLILILPLALVFAACLWVIVRGLLRRRRGLADAVPPQGEDIDPQGLHGGPGGGGTPR